MSFRSFRILSVFSLFLFSTLSAFGQTGLVISQIYGGGGNSGAPYTFDYVELYNNSSSPISLNGDSIQYAAGWPASISDRRLRPTSTGCNSAGSIIGSRAATRES